MVMNMHNFTEHVILEESPRNHFLQTPNIAWELVIQKKISKDAYLLYEIYRRTCGEYGSCWKSYKTLSQELGVSKGQISKKRKELEQSFEILNGLPLVKVVKGDRAKNQSDTVFITDVWSINSNYFKKVLPVSGEKHPVSGEKQGVSGGKPNKITYNNIPKKKSYPQSSSSTKKTCKCEDPPNPVNIDDDDKKTKPSIDVNERDLEVIRTDGSKQKVTLSSIYTHFSKLPQFSTEIVQEAIKRLRSHNGMVNNVLKYLESICNGILHEQKSSRKSFKETKNKPKNYDSEPIAPVQTVNFMDFHRKTIGKKGTDDDINR